MNSVNTANNLTTKNNSGVSTFFFYFILLIFSIFVIMIIVFYINYSMVVCGPDGKIGFFEYLSYLDINAPFCKEPESVRDYIEREVKKEDEIFHISDQRYTYPEAYEKCKAYGAELATYNQLVDAYKKGANWCSKGWVKGQMALYPVQEAHWDKVQENEDDNARIVCGLEAGINGGYHQNKNLQFGVNCYGDKRAPVGDERMKHEYLTDKERALRQKIAMFQKQLGNFRLAPFNEDKWGSCPGN